METPGEGVLTGSLTFGGVGGSFCQHWPSDSLFCTGECGAFAEELVETRVSHGLQKVARALQFHYQSPGRKSAPCNSLSLMRGMFKWARPVSPRTGPTQVLVPEAEGGWSEQH